MLDRLELPKLTAFELEMCNDNKHWDKKDNEERSEESSIEEIICDQIVSYLGTIPESERITERSKIITKMCYKIIKNTPNYDELIDNAKNKEEIDNYIDQRHKYQQWLISDNNYKEKETAMLMVFNEILETSLGEGDLTIADNFEI